MRRSTERSSGSRSHASKAAPVGSTVRPSATIPAGDRLTTAANSGKVSSKTSTTPPPAAAIALIPARTVLPTACAICSSCCPALRAAAFACWSICRWAARWVCCFALCWAAVMVGAGGFCAGWRGTVAVCCAAAVCSVDCHISRCRTCTAVVSCRCRTFWVRYLCRAYFRWSCCMARKVRRAVSAVPCCACSVAYSTG